MTRYSIDPREKRYVKGNRFLLFTRNLLDKYGEKVLDTATKTTLDSAKISSKKGSS